MCIHSHIDVQVGGRTEGRKVDWTEGQKDSRKEGRTEMRNGKKGRRAKWNGRKGEKQVDNKNG